MKILCLYLSFKGSFYTSYIYVNYMKLHLFVKHRFCYDDVNCILVAQHGDQWFAAVNRILECCFVITKGNVLTELSDCELLKISASCS
jgi:hypothetical protein